MVFSSSIPIYLDPSNWQQEQLIQQTGGENSQLPPPPPCGGGGVSIRPGSMADRARLAKIPQPEAALKCPRCDSTNTKFCYFNNYNLSQPRHFCKTCRRYWTRGGALRNVPVGGGSRRNKKRKGSGRSKSPVASGSSSTSALASNSCSSTMLGHMPPPPTQLPLLPPLSHLSEYNSRDIIGLNLGAIQATVAGTGGAGDMEFQIGSSNSSGASASIVPSGIVEQWRLQQVHHHDQFPNFLGNLEETTTTTNGLYPFDQGSHEGYVGQLRLKPLDSVVAPLGSVEMEENHHQGLNLSRNILGVNNPGNQDHHQYWGTGTTSNSWNDLHSAFNSFSTGHLL